MTTSIPSTPAISASRPASRPIKKDKEPAAIPGGTPSNTVDPGHETQTGNP